MTPKPRRRRRKIIIAVAAALLAICALSIWASMNVLTVTEYRVESPKMTRALRLALLSDLHDHTFGHDNDELVKRIAALRPDAVMFTGDAINYYSDNDDVLTSLVSRLSRLCPVYFTVGNHDVRFMALHRMIGRIERLERAGAVVLNSSYLDVMIKGQHLRVGGLYNYAFNKNEVAPDAYRASEAYQFLADFEDTDAYKLLLTHKPTFLISDDEEGRWDIDLALCGHEHGGQVRLPLIGNVYSPHLGWFSPYVDGAHLINGIPTIITRGLSTYTVMYNGLPTPPRLFNLPEIVLITLEAGE